MPQTIHIRQVDAHYDGKHLVFDEPVSLPIGVPLKVSAYEIVARPTPAQIEDALDAIAELGRGVPPIEERYILDRETYYEGRE